MLRRGEAEARVPTGTLADSHRQQLHMPTAQPGAHMNPPSPPPERPPPTQLTPQTHTCSPPHTHTWFPHVQSAGLRTTRRPACASSLVTRAPGARLLPVAAALTLLAALFRQRAAEPYHHSREPPSAWGRQAGRQAEGQVICVREGGKINKDTREPGNAEIKSDKTLK